MVSTGEAFDSPYTKYSMYVSDLQETIALLYVALIFLQPDLNRTQLAEVIFEKLREQEIVFDFGDATNWVPINKCMAKVFLLCA